MQQIKIFKTIEADITATEKEINAWMRDSGARILSITGNISPQSGNPGGKGSGYIPSDVLLIVLYEEGAV